MGVSKEQREERRAKQTGRRATKTTAYATYVELRIPRDKRETFRKELVDDNTLWDFLREVTETEEYSFRVVPDKDRTALKAEIWDNTIAYNKRVILTARHEELGMVLAILRWGYYTVYGGIPTLEVVQAEESSW